MGAGGMGRGENCGQRGGYYDASRKFLRSVFRIGFEVLTATRPRRIIIAEDATMARTTDSARFEGFVIAVNGRWGGFLRMTYPSPLDVGAMVKIEDWVLFISSISPITATGATEYYPQIAKGETAGEREK